MNNYFSVIIPLYNKEPYIQRALESVLNQTYGNFEVIVVDDGSSDNGYNIVQKISDERIKLISQKNGGVSVARNKGALLAKNPYLAFLDADDTWEPSFLQEMSDLINQFPNAGIFGTNNNFVYPSGKVITENFSNLFDGKKTGIIKDYFGLFAKIQKSPFSNSNVCIPKNIYSEFGGYKEGVKLTEDSDLWCRIAFKYNVAFNITPLANYFLAIDGSTHTIFQEEEYQVTKTLKEALVNGALEERLKSSVKKLIVFQKMGLIKRSLMSGNKRFVYRHIFDWDLCFYYPKEFFICMLSLIIPYGLFNKLRKMKFYKF